MDDVAEKLREILFTLDPYDRAEAIRCTDLCPDCGDDLRLPDGKRKVCYCTRDD